VFLVIVSNSEVETYQRCPKQHWYAYGLNVTPTQRFMPIRCGIMGHEVLEAYYKAKQAGLPHDKCRAAGLAVIADYITTKGDSYGEGGVFSIVTKRFMEYASHYKDEPWKILDVEGVYSVPMGYGIEYALTIDMLVEWTSGSRKGQQCIVEHKWCYNFWSADEVYMMGQLTKYLWAMQKLGSNATIGIVNQIRYRDLKPGYTADNIFKRAPHIPEAPRIEKLADIQFRMAMKLAKVKEERHSWESMAIPSVSRQNCKNCFFQIPCNIELDGRDPSQVFKINFIPNTYGYSQEKIRRSLD
jgi:hypothetical protein